MLQSVLGVDRGGISTATNQMWWSPCRWRCRDTIRRGKESSTESNSDRKKRNGTINSVESHETDNNDKHESITTVGNPFEGQEEEEVDGQVPNFHPNSCIIVLGTTGRGKTTTMNLYTGNTADTGDASHSTTKTNKIYHDQVRHYLLYYLNQPY